MFLMMILYQATHTSYSDAIGKADTWEGYTQQEQVRWEVWMKTFLVVLYLFLCFLSSRQDDCIMFFVAFLDEC